MQKCDIRAIELVLLSVNGLRDRMSRERFDSYLDCEMPSADRDDYWLMWKTDPTKFFNYAKSMREPILLELMQWMREF